MVAASNVILFESTLMQKMYKENEEMEIKEIKKYNNKFKVVSIKFVENYLQEGNSLLEAINTNTIYFFDVEGQTLLLFNEWMKTLHAVKSLYMGLDINESQMCIRKMLEIYYQIKYLLLDKEEAKLKCGFIIMSMNRKKREIIERQIKYSKDSDENDLKCGLELLDTKLANLKNIYSIENYKISRRDWYEEYYKYKNNTKKMPNISQLISFNQSFDRIKFQQLTPRSLRELFYTSFSMNIHGLLSYEGVWSIEEKIQLVPHDIICNGSLWLTLVYMMYEDMYFTFCDFFEKFKETFPRDSKMAREQEKLLYDMKIMDEKFTNLMGY